MGKGETAGGDLTTVIRSMISMNKGTNLVIMRTVAAFALALALVLLLLLLLLFLLLLLLPLLLLLLLSSSLFAVRVSSETSDV